MGDFGDEAVAEPEAAERETYDLDDKISDEVDAYMGYEDDDDSDDQKDDESAEPDDEQESKLADDEEEEDKEEEEQEAQKPVKKGSPRTEKRIRQLIQKSKEKEQELEGLRQRHDDAQRQMYQWQMHQQQQQAEFDKQLALVRAENERYSRDREIQEEANLDPVERMRRETARSARDATLAEINPQVQELRDIIEKDRKNRADDIARQKHMDRIRGYETQSYSAADALLDNFEPKQVEFLRNKLSSHVLNWAAAVNKLPQDAAKEFDLFATKYVAAKQAARKKRNGDALARSAKTPKSIPNKRPSAKGGKKFPSFAEIQKQGYPDALAYLEAQGNL